MSFSVNKREIIFGNYEKDKWLYLYRWDEGCFYEKYAVQKTEEEKEQSRKLAFKKLQQKNIAKCKKLGINPDWLDCELINPETQDKIKFLGFTKRRKYPISYIELSTNKSMVCNLNYFNDYKKEN